jgi:hypothetical protein
MNGFNMATRQAKIVLPAMAYSASANVTQDLPQTGYLAAINLLMTGSVATGASTGATAVNTYIQTPWNIIKRIILRTNEGADIWSTSGWGAYLYNRVTRTGLDYHTNHSDYLRASGVDPFARYFVNPGTLGASASSDIRAFWRMPISWGEMNLTGLLLLQNPGVRFTLEIQWGNVATAGDLFASQTLATVSNLQILPQLELYHLPANADDDPNLAFAKTVLEDRKDIVSVGDVVYNPLMGNVYNRIIQEFVNGGTAPMSPADITQFSTSFAQTQRVYTENADIKLADQRRIYGSDLPEGVYVSEFSLPNGFPELPGGRDQFDTSQITDMAQTATLRSGMTLNSGSYVRNIREQLVTIQG